jgi:hypothetical protein
MAVRLHHARGNVYRIAMSGRLRAADLKLLEETAASEIRRAGKIRLLIALDAFEGWDEAANWRDLGFYVKHGDDIERIAIVGENRWRAPALMFAGAGLRRAPVVYFEPPDAKRAEDWLGE